MSFKYANHLVRVGQYEAAEKIYTDLYRKNPLEVYETSLNFIRHKLNRQVLDRDLNSSSNVTRMIFVTAGIKGPTAGGGIATCFDSMIKTLAEDSSNKISILYLAHPFYAKQSEIDWKKSFKDNLNVDFYTVEINKKNYGSQEMNRSYAAMLFLAENQENYDKFIFHDHSGLAYYSLLAKKYGIFFEKNQIIISAHGNHTLSYHFGLKRVNTWNEKVAIFMERLSLSMADQVTTPSNYYKEWIAQNFGVNNCIHIPNIILSDKLDERLDVKFKDGGKQLLVFYGRLERLKGLDVFINAMIECEKNGLRFNILFAGNSVKIDGHDSQAYIENAFVGIKSEFKFKFNCKAESLYKYVKDNEGICIFPTLGETSSCVVVECIQYAVKFIASDIPGIKELISNNQQSDYLVKSGSVEALVARLSLPVKTPDEATLSFDMKQNKELWKQFLTKKYEHKEKINNYKIDDLVTVIIPTCDRDELLKTSIESIKNQSYPNIEIIVVDDASVNSSSNKAIADKMGVKYVHSSTKVFKGSACNKGVDAASGKYICFFDDDDIAKSNMIENYLRAYSLDKDVDILSGFADCFEHEHAERVGTIYPEYTSLALGGGLEVNSHINFFGKGTFIIKADKFRLIGGYEADEDSVPMVDYRFYIKAVLNGLKVSIVPVVQYYYRKNSPNSLFYQNKDKRHLKYLAKKSMENLVVRRFGYDIGKSFSSVIWHIGLPHYE